MRTLKIAALIIINLIRFNKKLTNKAREFHTMGAPLKAYRFIDYETLVFMKKIVEISGAKVEVEGTEDIGNNETYLFVGNHQSNFDIPLLYTYSPIKMAFVAKQEVRKIPIMGKLMELRGHVFLNRDNPKEAVKSIQQGIGILKSGESLAVFPEGRRSKTGEINSFKSGSLRLALKSGVKIVPFVINGSYKLLEANGGRVKPANVKIKFLKPIDPKNYKDAVKLTEELEFLIKNELKESI